MSARGVCHRRMLCGVWIAVVLIPVTGAEGQPEPQGEIPNSFLVGEEVLVARTDGTLIRGRWAGMGATITVRSDGRASVFPAPELAAVWRVRVERPIGKAALLGLGLGAGFGLALAASACEGDCDAAYFPYLGLTFGGIGSGLGAALGALAKDRRFEPFAVGAFVGADEARARWEAYDAALRRRLEAGQEDWLRLATVDGKTERYKIKSVDSSSISVWRISGGKDIYKLILWPQLLGILED